MSAEAGTRDDQPYAASLFTTETTEETAQGKKAESLASDAEDTAVVEARKKLEVALEHTEDEIAADQARNKLEAATEKEVADEDEARWRLERGLEEPDRSEPLLECRFCGEWVPNSSTCPIAVHEKECAPRALHFFRHVRSTPPAGGLMEQERKHGSKWEIGWKAFSRDVGNLARDLAPVELLRGIRLSASETYEELFHGLLQSKKVCFICGESACDNEDTFATQNGQVIHDRCLVAEKDKGAGKYRLAA